MVHTRSALNITEIFYKLHLGNVYSNLTIKYTSFNVTAPFTSAFVCASYCQIAHSHVNRESVAVMSWQDKLQSKTPHCLQRLISQPSSLTVHN